MRAALVIAAALVLCKPAWGQSDSLALPQDRDAQARAKTAIEKVRSQQSYRTKFTAEIKIPNSDPMLTTGESVWCSGGVLFITYYASGGEVRRIVRVGDSAWVYHELAEEWVPAEQMGMPAAGRGVQDSDGVLAVLVKHLSTASPAGKSKVGDHDCDQLNTRLSGEDIEKIMKEQASQGSFDWKESTADVKLFVGADDLIYRFTVTAELVSAEASTKGQKVRYAADVTVVTYNSVFALPFAIEDPKTKKKTDISMDPAVLDALERRSGIPRELQAEVARMREARITLLVADLGAKNVKVREAAGVELERFGKAAVPALKKALDDKDRAAAARKLLEKIEK